MGGGGWMREGSNYLASWGASTENSTEESKQVGNVCCTWSKYYVYQAGKLKHAACWSGEQKMCLLILVTDSYHIQTRVHQLAKVISAYFICVCVYSHWPRSCQRFFCFVCVCTAIGRGHSAYWERISYGSARELSRGYLWDYAALLGHWCKWAAFL